jgi:flagellar hook-length control protein FliK
MEKMQEKGHTYLPGKDPQTDIITNPTHNKQTGQHNSSLAHHTKFQSDNVSDIVKPEITREAILPKEIQQPTMTNDHASQQSIKPDSLTESQNQTSGDTGSHQQSSLWQEGKRFVDSTTEEKTAGKLRSSEPNPIKIFPSANQRLHLKESISGRSKQVQQLIREITRQISLKIDRKRADIQIRVTDENLGQLKVKLQIKEDVAKLLVITESDESRQILQKHAPQLRENLAQHGIRVEKFDFWTVQEKQEQIAGQMGQSHHQSTKEREQNKTHSTSGGSTLRITQAEAEESTVVRKPRRTGSNTLDVMV